MIRVIDLSLRLGDFSLSRVSFQVMPGQYAVLMGRTGSGKTSILEAICGLRRIESGQIHLDGREVTHRKPAARGVGYVPQDGALFQTMTVREHLAFALQVRRANARMIEQRVHEMSQLLEINHLLNRYPKGLSGGEQQRVALGRALAPHPAILLLDEPLSALDHATKQQMYELLMRVREVVNVTALHVTHSHSEAKALADCILQIENGQIVVDVQGQEHQDSEDTWTVRN